MSQTDKEFQRAITLALIFLFQMFILWISMCLPNFMKFHHCLFKILENQNVADGRTEGRTDERTDGRSNISGLGLGILHRVELIPIGLCAG